MIIQLSSKEKNVHLFMYLDANIGNIIYFFLIKPILKGRLLCDLLIATFSLKSQVHFKLNFVQVLGTIKRTFMHFPVIYNDWVYYVMDCEALYSTI